ncbi:MAG: tetratricopeptide repeat protein, partial [Acidobacteriota bacterium]|nr:tetratricopeptide repeat protein [Acidobacteriota bacterium]
GQPAIAQRLEREARRRGPSPHADATDAWLAALAGQATAEQLLESLSDAVDRAPDSVALRFARAGQLRALGRTQEALDDLEAVLASRPEDLRARLLHARTLAAVGRFEDARREFDALLASRLAFTEAQVWADAAVTSAALGDFETAADKMTRFLAASPQSDREWALLAQIYSRSGDDEEEQRALRNAKTARRNRLLEAHREARIAAAFGATATSIGMLRRIVSQHPDYAAARRDLQSLEAGRRIEW